MNFKAITSCLRWTVASATWPTWLRWRGWPRPLNTTGKGKVCKIVLYDGIGWTGRQNQKSKFQNPCSPLSKWAGLFKIGMQWRVVTDFILLQVDGVPSVGQRLRWKAQWAGVDWRVSVRDLSPQGRRGYPELIWNLVRWKGGLPMRIFTNPQCQLLRVS